MAVFQLGGSLAGSKAGTGKMQYTLIFSLPISKSSLTSHLRNCSWKYASIAWDNSVKCNISKIE